MTAELVNEIEMLLLEPGMMQSRTAPQNEPEVWKFFSYIEKKAHNALIDNGDDNPWTRRRFMQIIATAVACVEELDRRAAVFPNTKGD